MLYRVKVLAILLAIVVVIESGYIIFAFVQRPGVASLRPVGSPVSYQFTYPLFNQPISNDTDKELSQSYYDSWTFTVSSTLSPGSAIPSTESEVALAPNYPSEALSIPTLIVQERADGLIRIEYFAQNWPGSYGLVLYNSTAISWKQGTNITLQFQRFGPPSAVNPAIAPRPDGNLTILIGGQVVVSDYMIAWASLGELYLYGYPGSNFVNGTITVSTQALAQ